MAIIEVTDKGIVHDSYQQIYDKIANGLKLIYGPNLNLDQDSPDGQRVGIHAKIYYDLVNVVLDVNTSSDADLANGTALGTIGKLSGLTRRLATYSYVDVTITTNKPVTLPRLYTVKDITSASNSWILSEETDLVFGNNTVTLFAANLGNVEAEALTPDLLIEHFFCWALDKTDEMRFLLEDSIR